MLYLEMLRICGAYALKLRVYALKYEVAEMSEYGSVTKGKYLLEFVLPNAVTDCPFANANSPRRFAAIPTGFRKDTH